MDSEQTGSDRRSENQFSKKAGIYRPATPGENDHPVQLRLRNTSYAENRWKFLKSWDAGIFHINCDAAAHSRPRDIRG